MKKIEILMKLRSRLLLRDITEFGGKNLHKNYFCRDFLVEYYTPLRKLYQYSLKTKMIWWNKYFQAGKSIIKIKNSGESSKWTQK